MMDLSNEFDVSVLLEEFEIGDEIELLRTHFQLRQTNHFRQVALAVAPEKRRYREAPEGGRGKAFAFLARRIVQRDGPHTFAAHDDLLRLCIARRNDRFNRAETERRRTISDRSLHTRL